MFQTIKSFFSRPDRVRLPYILNRKQVYVFPNRYGLLFIVILLGMLIGSINYNNNLGFLLTFLLGGITFISVFYTFRNIAGMPIVSITPKPTFAGELAEFELFIRTSDTARIGIEFAFPNETPIRFDFAPQQDHRIKIYARTQRRGIFHPGSLLIFTTYPLGLFRSWSRLYFPVECPVYPKPLPGPFNPSQYALLKEDSEGESETSGVDDFQGLRNYQPGDPPQHIAWKVFSRGQGVFTKHFTGKSGSAVLLDFFSIRESDFERKLSRLSHMVLKAHSVQIEYGIKLPGFSIEPDKGEAHKHKCLRTLAMIDGDR